MARPAPRSLGRAARCLAAVTLHALLTTCAAKPPAWSEQPFAPPRVVRGEGALRKDVQLEPRGALGATAAKSLAEAFARTVADRAKTGAQVHVLVREAAGWVAYGYSSSAIANVALPELVTAGLPLAADPEAPLTFLADSTGSTGRIVAAGRGFAIQPVAITPEGDIVSARAGEDPLRLSPDARAASRPVREPSPSRPVVTGFVVPDVQMRNHAQNVRWSPAYVFRPGTSLGALAAGLAWMSAHLGPSIPIRAVGARHSWSGLAEAEGGVTVLPDDCQGTTPVAEATPTSGALWRVLAGTTIRELNAALAARELAIPYLGGFDGQTIGGVFATGTHGSVPSLGPLSDLVRSVDLVRFDGRILRIEPARRPVTVAAALAATAPHIELRVDDDLFDAVRIGLGAFGVLHSVVLETAPKYWLREVRTLVTMGEVKERCRGGRLREVFEPRDYVLARLRDRDLPDYVAPQPVSGFKGHPAPAFHIEFLWNPYGPGKALVTTRHWVATKQREEFERREPADFDGRPRRDLLRCLDPRTVRFSRPGLTELLAADKGALATAVVEKIQRDAPDCVPELVDATIAGLANPDGYVRRSYDVFNIGDAANQLPSLSATISVPVRDDLWIRAVDVLHRNAEALLATGLVETAPISLRFVAGSSAFLADPEDVCKFEIIFAGTGDVARRQADAIVSAHVAALRAELGDVVRLHFGQLIPPGTLDQAGAAGRYPVETTFPRYADWRRLRDQTDPQGHGLSPWLRGILPQVK